MSGARPGLAYRSRRGSPAGLLCLMALAVEMALAVGLGARSMAAAAAPGLTELFGPVSEDPELDPELASDAEDIPDAELGPMLAAICGAANVAQGPLGPQCALAAGPPGRSLPGQKDCTHLSLISMVTGRFTGPGEEEALVEYFGCEPKAGGGSALLRRSRAGWQRLRLLPGVHSDRCLRFRRSDGKDALACFAGVVGVQGGRCWRRRRYFANFAMDVICREGGVPDPHGDGCRSLRRFAQEYPTCVIPASTFIFPRVAVVCRERDPGCNPFEGELDLLEFRLDGRLDRAPLIELASALRPANACASTARGKPGSLAILTDWETQTGWSGQRAALRLHLDQAALPAARLCAASRDPSVRQRIYDSDFAPPFPPLASARPVTLTLDWHGDRFWPAESDR